MVLQETTKDVASYLANPVNEYLLIKLASEWPKVRDFINQQYARVGDTKIQKMLPTTKDASDAALGILRLQTIYQLATRDLAMGKVRISAKQYSISQHQMAGMLLNATYKIVSYIFPNT